MPNLAEPSGKREKKETNGKDDLQGEKHEHDRIPLQILSQQRVEDMRGTTYTHSLLLPVLAGWLM